MEFTGHLYTGLVLYTGPGRQMEPALSFLNTLPVSGNTLLSGFLFTFRPWPQNTHEVCPAGSRAAMPADFGPQVSGHWLPPT